MFFPSNLGEPHADLYTDGSNEPETEILLLNFCDLIKDSVESFFKLYA